MVEPWPVDCGPGVGVPGERKACVPVDHEALDWEDDYEHGKHEEEEAEEAGFVEVAVGRVDNLAELASIFLETVEDDSWKAC